MVISHQMPNRLALSVIPLTIVMVALLLWIANRGVPAPESVTPDFGAISDVKTKKKPSSPTCYRWCSNPIKISNRSEQRY